MYLSDSQTTLIVCGIGTWELRPENRFSNTYGMSTLQLELCFPAWVGGPASST